jgi:polar amino acid transport system substrate-binding protein
VAAACVFAAMAATVAAQTSIPNFWDPRERITPPSVDEISRLRFLTTIDFPPFSHLDAGGRLTGFHVDLARAICGELALDERCQIQALPWNELEGALERGDGDAIIAGIAITAEKRERLAFTRPYLKFPARFVLPVAAAATEPLTPHLAGRRIGVVAGSAHEGMLRDYFPAVRPITYDRADWMYQDMKGGRLDGMFGDGMQLSFWLGSEASGNCCRFAGGPYLSDSRLGLGLAIAAPRDRAFLVDALNYALREIHTRGTFGEIYLRYFPVGFY